LHIGHAKSVCLNFSLADTYAGRCHLRFDDTDPAKEEVEYVQAIQRDIRWLGFDWGAHLYYASDYFERLYAFAVELIERGHAYVCSQSQDEVRKSRGTVTEPGTASPYRQRTVAENIDLFGRMRAGDFADGAHTLRAKIDMAAANMKMRDPPLYRIRNTAHYRQGSRWCIYPMYDFAHCLSDALEGISHSICTLEFENNRELYDWILARCSVLRPLPRQYEFARLDLTYTMTSKRKLLRLVRDGIVAGWDDPRMPTLAGYRRRGVRPEAIRTFCQRIGVAKANSRVDLSQLEDAIRDDLNFEVPRVLCVLRPLKVMLTNVEPQVFDAPLYPHDVPKHGTRDLAIGREIYIEESDFSRVPPPGWKRLQPGGTVRLRHAFVIRCDEVVEEAGAVVALRCRRVDEKPKGTIHWADASAVQVEVRLYERLFRAEDPNEGALDEVLNPHSRVVVEALLEPYAATGERFQFERHGYFARDPDSTAAHLVFNRIVPLRDRAAGAPHRERSEDNALPPQQRTYSQEAVEYAQERGVSLQEAETLLLRPGQRTLFEAAGYASWVLNAVPEAWRETKLTAEMFARAMRLHSEGKLSSTRTRELLDWLGREGGDVDGIVASKGWLQERDPAQLAAWVDEVLREHSDAAAAYRAGKDVLVGFLVGKVMAKSRGTADPSLVRAAFEARRAAGAT
jgi:glutaminyl-tRNA synthetase